MAGEDHDELVDGMRLLAFHLRCLGEAPGTGANVSDGAPYRHYARIFEAIAERLTHHPVEFA